MTQIVVSAEVETWTTRDRDPDDDWDQGDTAGRVDNVWAAVDTGSHAYYGESHGKDVEANVGDTVYAVVADYESGCTFGRDGGHAQVLDFFLNINEAETLATAAQAVTRSTFGLTHNGVEYHTSWTGYFESLNSIDVWECVIRKSARDPWSREGTTGYKIGR